MVRTDEGLPQDYGANIVALSAEQNGGKVFLSIDFSKYTLCVFALWPSVFCQRPFYETFVACLWCLFERVSTHPVSPSLTHASLSTSYP